MRHLLFVIFSLIVFNKCASIVGLYEDDGVISVLTVSNFSSFVKIQPTFVQFYLHTCGSCRNYVSTFKNLSRSIENWQWAVRLAVVDCADPDNKIIRDEYNVSIFPTFLFFLKGTEPIQVKKIFDEVEFRSTISGILVNKTQSNRLIPVRIAPNALTISGPNNSEVAMLILDLQTKMTISLQSGFVEDSDYVVKDPYGRTLLTSKDIGSLRDFLLKKFQIADEIPSKKVDGASPVRVEKGVSPVAYSMPVYAADVIASLQNLLVHDVSIKKVIKGSELDALKEFLTVLSKYLDLGRQYNEEIALLKRKVDQKSEISRQEWLNFLAEMNLSTDQVQFIACRGSKPYLRGYPCGLWIMFHSMTVNRFIQGEKSDGVAPIAHALNRFVPRFFSCSYCAFHFAKMTSNVRFANEEVYPNHPGVDPPFPLVVPDPATLPTAPKSAREEVLWLNTAHNLVNKRLSGNPSEDPAAPKTVFPSPAQCRSCWSETARQQVEADKFAATPDKTEELLAYLVHHYRPSSWRWDGVCISFEDISQLNWGDINFSRSDMILVGVISVCSAGVVGVLLAFICCRWRCSRRDALPLPTTA